MSKTWKTLKVFISSTFLDLELERDQLHNIFEKIEQRILERRLTICSYDLRWRDRSSKEPILDWCLRMVEKCDYFIGIIGNRYGWIPSETEDEKPNVSQYSVTEMEIRKALKTIPKKQRFFCFTELGDEKDNPEAISKLKKYLREKQETIFDCSNIEALLIEVQKHFQKIIDTKYPNKKQVTIVKQNSNREALRKIIAEKVQNFCGRKKYLIDLHKFADSVSRKNYRCIEAVAGAGKSAFLAKFICERKGTKIPIIAHFMGMGRDARQISGIIKSIAEQLIVWNIITGQVPSDIESLQNRIRNALEKTSKPLILLIDGLDEIAENGRDLLWLPRSLPPNIRVILATRPVDTLDCLQSFPFIQTIQLPSLSEDEMQEVITSYMTKYKITFSRDDIVLLLERAAGNPLYLKVALEEVAISGIAVGQLALNVEALFEQIISRLEIEFQKKLKLAKIPAQEMINSYLGFIAAGENGILEKELKDLLHVGDDIVLSATKALRNFIVERDNFFNFFHPQFELAIKMRQGKSGMRDCHTKIANYLQNKGYSYYRTIEELPYQLQWSEQYAELLKILTDLTFLEKKCNAQMIPELKKDFHFALNGQVVKIKDNIKYIINKDTTVNREIISFLDRAISINGQFLQNFPQSFFQMIWNYGYWHDSPACNMHYQATKKKPPWDTGSDKLYNLVEHWRKNRSQSPWLQSSRPFPTRLDSSILNIFPHQQPITGIDISNDGNKVISGSYDCKLRVWDIHTNEVLLEHLYETPINDVVFSPDGSIAYVASLQVDAWDISSGKKFATIGPPNVLITKLNISIDGALLAIVTAENQTLLWSTTQKKIIAEFIGHEQAISSVSISPNSQLLATGSYDSSMKIWDIKKQTLVSNFKSEGIISGIAFHPNGNFLAMATHVYLKIWDIEKQEVVHKQNFNVPMSVCYSLDGEKIAIGSQEIKILCTKNYETIVILEGHDNIVGSIAFTPDGKNLISGSMDKTVRLWSLQNKKTSVQLCDHKYAISALTISTDSSYVASASFDQNIIIWDGKNGQKLHEFLIEPASCLCFSSDNTKLAIGSFDKKIILWDLIEQKIICTLEQNSRSVTSLCFNEDNTLIASASNEKDILLWETATKQCLAKFSGHQSSVINLEIVGNKLKSRCYLDEKVWDLKTQNCLETNRVKKFEANTGVHSLQIKDGKTHVKIGDTTLYFSMVLENAYSTKSKIIGNVGNSLIMLDIRM